MIKVRVWSEQDNRMYYDSYIHDYFIVSINDNGKLSIGTGASGTWDECKIMLSTGLKDMNNKEIFEGDIVRNYDDGDLYEVKYDNFKVGLYLEGIGFYDYSTFDDYIRDYKTFQVQLDVVGNIFENKDLWSGQ